MACMSSSSLYVTAERGLYELLGISDRGTLRDIKQAYKQLVLKYHPDVSPPQCVQEYTNKFIWIQEAYETLSDPNSRALYDSDLARGLHMAFSASKQFRQYKGLDLDVRGEWKRQWETQLKELKRRRMNKDSRSNMSCGARMHHKPKPKTKESSCRLPPFRRWEHRQFCLPPPSSSPAHRCPVRSKLECKKKDANGNSKSRSEIGKTWHLLSIEERAKFGQAADAAVAARNIFSEQPHHESFVIPNNFDFPPTDEEIPGTTNHLTIELKPSTQGVHPFSGVGLLRNYLKSKNRLFMCWGLETYLPSIVDVYGSSSVDGSLIILTPKLLQLISTARDLEDQISISGDVPNLDFWKSKFPITSCGIFLKDIEHSLEEMTMIDNEFKMTLCLFLLDTILSPSASDYVQTGIEKFQKNRPIMQTCCISGCVLFLQISVAEFFKQPTQSNGQYNYAAHGETSQADRGPVTSNHAHMKGIADILQLVKEIQSTMKTELDDIRTKVNFLYEKFSSAEDRNLDNNLHNTSNHHNSMHNIPPNPTPPPPLPSSRPLSNPTSQHPTIEVSSNNTRTLPQHMNKPFLNPPQVG
ncbi:hypothetical protein LWI28_017204 [Acer negundo]|uniref:J domain-containing protein n=1 Tax=Acer negundo TaxID=4023 RepID=A0AAD5IUJ0_ACENE|nr:hypothetical protein LWI28_017204 [Acer negundo]